jgi:hypothetical protein
MSKLVPVVSGCWAQADKNMADFTYCGRGKGWPVLCRSEFTSARQFGEEDEFDG